MKLAGSVITSPSFSPDTYVYRIIPFGDRLASISSDDSLRLIDSQTLQLVPEYIINHVHDGVTSLEAAGDRGILTAGRDGVVRCTDLRTKKRTLELLKGA